MSTPFQNRLVGTVMVAAAAVIFLPDILSGKKETQQADFEGIPQAPSITVKPEAKAFPKEQLAKIPKEKMDKSQALEDVFVKQPYNQVADEAPNANNIESEKVKITTLPKPDDSQKSQQSNSQQVNSQQVNTTKKKAAAQSTVSATSEQWVVQLGSFRHQKNVLVLVNKLKENNFTVFTKPIKTKNGTLTKVFVGPELVKSVLEKKLPKLKELTKINGKVARYKVTK